MIPFVGLLKCKCNNENLYVPPDEYRSSEKKSKFILYGENKLRLSSVLSPHQDTS